MSHHSSRPQAHDPSRAGDSVSHSPGSDALPAKELHPLALRKARYRRESRDIQTTFHCNNLRVHSSRSSVGFAAFPAHLPSPWIQSPEQGMRAAVRQSLSLPAWWDAPRRPRCGLRHAASGALPAGSGALLAEDTLQARGCVGNIIVPRGACRSCQISPEVLLPRYSQGRRPLPSRTCTWQPSCSTNTLMTSVWPCMAARCSGVYPQPDRASTSNASPAWRAASASSCRPVPSPCLASQCSTVKPDTKSRCRASSGSSRKSPRTWAQRPADTATSQACSRRPSGTVGPRFGTCRDGRLWGSARRGLPLSSDTSS